MLFLYNILLWILVFLFRSLSLFYHKPQNFLQNRKDRLALLRGKNWNDSKVYWLHAASVGELDQAKALAKLIREKEPKTRIVVSVFSNSVTPKQLDNPIFDAGFYLPLDLVREYKPYFELLKPHTVVILAWDTWPNFVHYAKDKGAKVYLACGSLHAASSRLRFPMVYLTKKTLGMLDGISPSSESRMELFQKLAPNVPVHTAGDSRFDSVIEKIESRANPPILPEPKEKVLILASTYTICEKILFPALPQILQDGFCIWIFPHKIDEPRLAEIEVELKKRNLDFSRYSIGVNSKITLFDKLGILAFAYEKAAYAYIGGAFHHRVHNVLEPAYFGLPICSGPKITHAPEALELQKKEGLRTFVSTKEFLQIHNFYKDSQNTRSIRQTNSKFVEMGRGSAKRFYEGFLA